MQAKGLQKVNGWNLQNSAISRSSTAKHSKLLQRMYAALATQQRFHFFTKKRLNLVEERITPEKERLSASRLPTRAEYVLIRDTTGFQAS